MSEVKEIRTYFGRCRCCLQYSYLKHMWTKHDYNGESEIYGEMLAHCFALAFDQSEDMAEEDQICEGCVVKLRDANNFKNLVLKSQEELLKLSDLDKPNVKIEAYEELDDIVVIDSSIGENTNTEEAQSVDNIEHDVNPIEFEECEFLEDDLLSEGEQEKERAIPDTSIKSEPDSSKKTTKWPKKLPRHERLKTYKQYTTESLKKSLEAVTSEQMTCLEAAELYNVPIKTLVAKVRNYKDAQPDPEKERTYDFIQEIKQILTYTNATPYKSKINRFYCAYCFFEGPIFEDPNELRIHTRTKHVNDRILQIEFAMRPHWMNEVLKLDIDNFLCNVCCTPIESWNDMFTHLKDQHDVVLDQAYKRVIPYRLTYTLLEELKCALCSKQYSNYMHLDAHMNAHYDNYVCCDCGDTYVSAYRLRQHVKVHDTGKYKCSQCPKVFALDKYRKKHVELVHEHAPIFKCLYCKERFEREYTRHLHVLDKHFEKTTVYTCEACDKSFTWRPYYLGHLRKAHHSKDKRHECKECGKSFLKIEKLNKHMLQHSGKRSKCNYCDKTYLNKASLNSHISKVHSNNVQLE